MWQHEPITVQAPENLWAVYAQWSKIPHSTFGHEVTDVRVCRVGHFLITEPPPYGEYQHETMSPEPDDGWEFAGYLTGDAGYVTDEAFRRLQGNGENAT
jgi:hypothetical protein